MVVYLHKHALDWFRRKARDSEKEILVYLVGRRLSKHRLHVENFVYPDLAISDRTTVQAAKGERQRITEQYATSGSYIVGDIHTHLDAPPILSRADFDAHVQEGSVVSGIVSVSGRKTWVSFWQLDSALSCGWTYHTS